MKIKYNKTILYLFFYYDLKYDIWLFSCENFKHYTLKTAKERVMDRLVYGIFF